MHDTCLCKLDGKITSTELKICKYKNCSGVKTGAHNIYVTLKDLTPEA